jgi:hypothetical protein
MNAARATARAAGELPPDERLAGGVSRRPWWVWAAPLVVVLTVLCVRNRFLFSARLYEQGDSGADSILIEKAMRFALLVGNYSREGFNHPGPAYLYVKAAGQWLFCSELHLVPTAWNGQMLAVYALNGCFVALVTGMVYGWTRSPYGAAACLAVLAAGAAVDPAVLSSNWMPYMYVPAYVTLVVAAASVAAGAGRDLWIMVLAGWFLIHGHAEFLLFVPAIWGAVAAAVVWRYGAPAVLRAISRARRWIPVAALSAVFLLPIVAELALHWPGNFGKYFSYGSSGRAGGHGLVQVIGYVLWFWWPRGTAVAWLVLLAGYAAAIAVTRWLAHPALRRFLATLLAVNATSMVLFTGYAAIGIDELSPVGRYIGYFSWSAPLVVALVIVVAAVCSLPGRVRACVAAVTAFAAVAAFAAVGGTRSSTHDIDPALPHAVAAAAAVARGRTVVIEVGDWQAMVQVPGFLVQAERTGVRACVDDPYLSYELTSSFICSPGQVASGARFLAGTEPLPRGARRIAQMGPAYVAAIVPGAALLVRQPGMPG